MLNAKNEVFEALGSITEFTFDERVDVAVLLWKNLRNCHFSSASQTRQDLERLGSFSSKKDVV